MKQLFENKDGFTFIDIIISIAILALFLGIYLNLHRGNYVEKTRTDEINKMTMVAQGIIEAYRKIGIVETNSNLTVLSQGYDVLPIIEDNATVMPTSNPIDQISDGLKKVTIIVNPKANVINISPIKMISYSN